MKRISVVNWIALITLIALVASRCHPVATGRDNFSKLDWHPVDSVFALSIQQRGSGSYQQGNLLGLELLGGVDVRSGRWVPAAQLDSAYAALASALGQRLLGLRLAGKVGRNAEGYIKAQFLGLFRCDSVRVGAYLMESVSPVEADSLARKLRDLPEVAGVRYISPDEAKRRFIAAGNVDFSSVLDKNPLPASLELTIKTSYCTPADLKKLKTKLLNGNADFADVVIPSAAFELELNNLATYNCIFRFKT